MRSTRMQGWAALAALVVGIAPAGAQTLGSDHPHDGVAPANQNTVVGTAAMPTGSNNSYLANPGGSAFENQTIRVGSAVNHTRAFVAGVSGVTTGLATTAAIVVDANGQLGTISSTRRVKEDIRDLGEVGRRLQDLRPVQFRYIRPFADGSKPVQYGLIAEELADVLPELVAYGHDGQPSTVMYHVLPRCSWPKCSASSASAPCRTPS